MDLNVQTRMTSLNYQQVLYYLGYRGQNIDENLKQQILNCMKLVEEKASPKIIYKIVKTNECALHLEGNDIQDIMNPSSFCVVMAATIGSDIDRLLMKTEITNVADALILDACANVAIENVCDHFEFDIRDELEGTYYVSDRFSPGYGDLPLDSQMLLCEYLNTSRTIGLNVTSNCLMIPRKSVTAILGISKTPYTLRKRGCEFCSMFMNCELRKGGRCCHE